MRGDSLLMNLEEDERFMFVWLICLRFANNESAKISIKSSFMEIVFSLCIQQNEVPGQNTSIWELITDSYLLISEENGGRCEAHFSCSTPSVRVGMEKEIVPCQPYSSQPYSSFHLLQSRVVSLSVF